MSSPKSLSTRTRPAPSLWTRRTSRWSGPPRGLGRPGMGWDEPDLTRCSFELDYPLSRSDASRCDRRTMKATAHARAGDPKNGEGEHLPESKTIEVAAWHDDRRGEHVGGKAVGAWHPQAGVGSP